MDEIKILDAVERYIRGEMTPDERLYFEQLRKTNPEIDQLVVEHTLFLQQMNRFGEWKKFKQALHDTHTNLTEQGKIHSDKLRGSAKVVYLWNKYKRVTAIAASIAGITALTISGFVWSVTPKTDPQELESLRRIITRPAKIKRSNFKPDLKYVKTKLIPPLTLPLLRSIQIGGTGFLIDGKV